MSRKNIDFNELDKSILLTVKTKCPEKYLLVDRETGDMFVGKETGEWELVRGGPHRHE
ncbi:MAG: hypothetical protein RLZZ328_1374 [Bacteroidota bacterium]|jgi:hypothetical protein